MLMSCRLKNFHQIDKRLEKSTGRGSLHLWSKTAPWSWQRGEETNASRVPTRPLKAELLAAAFDALPPNSELPSAEIPCDASSVEGLATSPVITLSLAVADQSPANSSLA